MPAAHLTFSNVASGPDVLSCDFESAELNSGDTYTFANANKKYVVVLAINEIYVAFTSNGATPNAAIGSRSRIPAGSTMAFSVRSGVKIAVLDV